MFDSNGAALEKLTEEQDLTLMNNTEPTYINSRNGIDTLLDLTFISPNLALQARTVVMKTSFDSDHFPIVTTVDGELKESIVYESRWNLKKADWKKFKQEAVKLVNIDQCTTSDVDELFQKHLYQIYNCAKAAIPTTNPRPPKTHTLKYWNEVIKTAIQQKNQAFHKWKKSNIIEDLVEYKRLRAVAHRTIREEAKLSKGQNFCEDLNDKDNISKVWKMAAKMGGRTFPPPKWTEKDKKEVQQIL